ncbi:hypothetical protein G9A89_021467 [Geosiphon pyriformis]|nr:hypothetical protein G9A89_021467 [Geosiphon pyriformis]
MKLFCMEFASQQSLEAAFLVELTSSVHLATLKIAKSLVVSESVSSFAAVALQDVSLGVFAADIKIAFSVFGSVACVVLKPAGIWQYMMAKLVNLPSGCTAFEISNMISQVGGRTCFIPRSPNSGHYFQFALVTFVSRIDLNSAIVKTEVGYLAVDCKVSPFLPPKAPKMFKPHFVGTLSYTKAFAFSVMSEFPPLVASAFSVAVVDTAVGSRLDSLEKQISDLAALVKSIFEPIGSLVALVSCLFDDNAIKTVQLEKDLLSMKYASNNFANLLVGVSKNIACLRSEVNFGGMDYNNIQTIKSFFLSEDTIECVVALWRMSDVEIRSSVESTRLFLNEFIFDSRNLNGVIEKIHGLELFPPPIVLV